MLKRFARTLVVMSGLASLSLVLTLVPRKTASGVVATQVNVVNTALPVVSATHLGTPPSNFVLLSCATNNFVCSSYQRLLPDGTPSATPFSIPAGQYLVVTDVEWTMGGGFAGQPADLFFDTVVGGNFIDYYSSHQTFDANVLAGASDHLTSGIVMSTLPETRGTGAIIFIKLRGYLTPAN